MITKCTHLIPAEIVARVIKAISDGEDFRVYINIPMFPEGDPTASAIQEMLHWQHETINMMYSKIAKAIRLNKSDAHPTDYLSFFCLGKREKRRLLIFLCLLKILLRMMLDTI